MRKSVCVTTSFDEPFASIGEYAAMSIEHYARCHGFSAHIERSFEIDRPPAWRRVRLIAELFDQGFDYVMWVDADAVFTRFDVSILSEVSRDAHLYLSKVPARMLSDQDFPNTGVMLIKNCDWSRSLLLTLWSMDQYTHHFLWENAAMVKLMGFNSLLGDGPDTPNDDFLKYVKWLPVIWNNIPGCSNDDDAIIVHWAGHPAEVRRREMPLRALSSAYNIRYSFVRKLRQAMLKLVTTGAAKAMF